MDRLACVDDDRVFATGYSGGGRMSSALACELSDTIAAIAPVAGLRAGRPSPVDIEVEDLRAVPHHDTAPWIVGPAARPHAPTRVGGLMIAPTASWA